MYAERLGHVWYDSDTIWYVRTICMRPSRRPLEPVHAGESRVARFGAGQTIPGGGGNGAFGALLAIPGGDGVIPNVRS
jgi:hypothetical protein